MQNFLDIDQVDPQNLRGILDEAARLKTARAGVSQGALDAERPLEGKMVALIFEKPYTRARVSFERAGRQMGCQTMVLSGSEMQLGHDETIADTARVLCRYVYMIMIRTFEEATLLEMAEYASVPVINGLTNRTHPCQIMADILTFEEPRGSIQGRRVVWTGDGNNVCASFIPAAGQLGFDFVYAGPETLDPEADTVARARDQGVKIERLRHGQEEGGGQELTETEPWDS